MEFWKHVAYATHATHISNIKNIFAGGGILSGSTRFAMGLMGKGIDDQEPNVTFSRKVYISIAFIDSVRQSLDNNEFEDDQNVVLIVDIKTMIKEKIFTPSPKDKNIRQNGSCYFNIYDDCGRIFYDDDINKTCTLDLNDVTPENINIVKSRSTINEFVCVGDIPLKYIRSIWCFNEEVYNICQNMVCKNVDSINVVRNHEKRYINA
jgi:hypothetical protein